MRLDTFKVERWMDEYEGFLTYDLGETCVDSLKIGELLKLCGKDPAEFMKELEDRRMVYGWIHGSDELKKGIASLYETMTVDDVVPTHGGISANHMVLAELAEPGKNVVTFVPTYQMHYSIPESIGAEVRKLHLKKEEKFLPNLEELKKLVDKDTVLIDICNPDNPTGAVIPKETMVKIVEIAKSVDAYLLCDEAYREYYEDGSAMYSAADLYEKGISTSSMSKFFGLAGLRIGWIATKDKDFMHRMHGRRDYDTISCGVIDDILAGMALAHKDKLIERNSKIIREGRAVLDQWVKDTPSVDYIKPMGGNTALVYYDVDVPSFEFCAHLVKDNGVLVTPGSAFEFEHCFRIGYAFSPDKLKIGLDIIAKTIEEYRK